MICCIGMILLFAACHCEAQTNSSVNPEIENRDRNLQEAFLRFPFFTPTNHEGTLMFQTLHLDNPVKINGTDFYGFRFKVPKRAAHEDFVWAFLEPVGYSEWYILPKQGKMTGFKDYLEKPRTSYRGLKGLFPLNAWHVILQQLSGDCLQDDEDYLIWFTCDPHPARISVKFTFADLGSKNPENRSVLERALDLERKGDAKPPQTVK